MERLLTVINSGIDKGKSVITDYESELKTAK
jgi:hypothetical protein